MLLKILVKAGGKFLELVNFSVSSADIGKGVLNVAFTSIMRGAVG